MGRTAGMGVLALLTLVAGCGSEAPEDPAAAPSSSAPSSADASSAAPSTSSAAPPATTAAAAPTVLTGTVGTKADPDAFVISLTDGSGRPVTELPAGQYTIEVQDLSDVHNFHLVGGTVDETTTVPEVVDTTFDVTLTPGEYEFVCDPHPRMTGSFTVT